MDTDRLKQFVETFWEDSIVPSITDYIRIPNKSPAFDPDWAEHGHMDEAVTLMEGWARAQLAGLPGATLEVVRLPGRTPVIVHRRAGRRRRHRAALRPSRQAAGDDRLGGGAGAVDAGAQGDKLYGRGGADDGYAMFGALAAMLALREQKVPHARCVILIEACEESGSYDLPFYVDHLVDRIGKPSLVVCLDSGCGDYERLWLTTSLRGIAAAPSRCAC